MRSCCARSGRARCPRCNGRDGCDGFRRARCPRCASASGGGYDCRGGSDGYSRFIGYSRGGSDGRARRGCELAARRDGRLDAACDSRTTTAPTLAIASTLLSPAPFSEMEYWTPVSPAGHSHGTTPSESVHGTHSGGLHAARSRTRKNLVVNLQAEERACGGRRHAAAGERSTRCSHWAGHEYEYPACRERL